jgi:hypothetical protein
MKNKSARISITCPDDSMSFQISVTKTVNPIPESKPKKEPNSTKTTMPKVVSTVVSIVERLVDVLKIICPNMDEKFYLDESHHIINHSYILLNRYIPSFIPELAVLDKSICLWELMRTTKFNRKRQENSQTNNNHPGLEFIRKKLKYVKQTCSKVTCQTCLQTVTEMLKDTHIDDEGTDSDEQFNKQNISEPYKENGHSFHDECYHPPSGKHNNSNHRSEYFSFLKNTINELKEIIPGLNNHEYMIIAAKMWRKRSSEPCEENNISSHKRGMANPFKDPVNRAFVDKTIEELKKAAPGLTFDEYIKRAVRVWKEWRERESQKPPREGNYCSSRVECPNSSSNKSKNISFINKNLKEMKEENTGFDEPYNIKKTCKSRKRRLLEPSKFNFSDPSHPKFHFSDIRFPEFKSPNSHEEGCNHDRSSLPILEQAYPGLHSMENQLCEKKMMLPAFSSPKYYPLNDDDLKETPTPGEENNESRRDGQVDYRIFIKKLMKELHNKWPNFSLEQRMKLADMIWKRLQQYKMNEVNYLSFVICMMKELVKVFPCVSPRVYRRGADILWNDRSIIVQSLQTQMDDGQKIAFGSQKLILTSEADGEKENLQPCCSHTTNCEDEKENTQPCYSNENNPSC